MASIITRSSSTLGALTKMSRPRVEINLDGQKQGLVNSYTTGDSITGSVSISVDYDTRFDDIDITFEGTSSTTVERAALPGRTGAYQTFLKLRQPIEQDAYPTPSILEPGRTYTFSFTFVVPDHLLPQVCHHSKNNAHVERSHTLLPPTMGDPMLASNGKTLLNDMNSEMCQIAYLVRVTIQKRPVSEGSYPKTLASIGKKVRILPIVEEEPPLNVADDDHLYSLRKEKDVKRGLMRGKLGRLTVAAAQPKPIQLTAPNTTTTNEANTVATVQLRFDPVANEQPPQLGSVWSKIKASTYYSASPWPDYPTASSAMLWSQLGRELYYETVPLSTLCVASAQWTKHTPDNLTRHDSLTSTSSDESLGLSGGNSTYYTTSILIPITLPSNKSFLPTFHSCLISRIYSLDLAISYHTPNANILTPSVSLKLPLQVSCQKPFPKAQKPAGIHIISQEEVENDFFTPRSVVPPTHSESEIVQIAPPEYSDLRPIIGNQLSRGVFSTVGTRTACA